MKSFRHPQRSEFPTRSKRGVALVMVLVALALCVSMVFMAQRLQKQRSTGIRIVEADAKLRHELLLLLQESMEILATDTNLTVDAPSEAWAQPLTGVSSNGVSFHLSISDAQSRFDINNLVLPEEETVSRLPAEILADLLVRCGRIREDETIEALRDWIDPGDEGIREVDWYRDQEEFRIPVNRPLYSLDELAGFSPKTANWLVSSALEQNRVREFEADFVELAAVIPLSRREPLPVNLNSADHELLIAVFGEGNRAWADTVAQVRANSPIQNLDAWYASMNPEMQKITREWCTVRSKVFEIQLRAFVKGFSRKLTSLVYRGDDGEVEVLQCQW